MNSYQDSKHQITHSKRPVLAEFYTQSCVPCKTMTPIIKRIEREYTGILKVLSIDAEEASDLCNHYDITSVPYILFLKEGKPVFEYTGFIPYASLKQLIDKNL